MRHRQSGLRVWITVPLAILLVLFGFGHSIADETKTEIYVANTNPEFVIDSPTNPANSYTVEVLLKGGQAGELVVEFVDYVWGPQGRVTVPGGSSPNSLQNAIYLEKTNLTYVPDGSDQVFALKFFPLESIEPRLYSGGLRIGFRPVADESGFASSALGVTKNLVVTPFGGATSIGSKELQPARLLQSYVSAIQRSSFIDSLLPDIPGIINFGPVEVKSKVENPGEYPVFVKVQWEFLNDNVLLAKQELPALLIGGGLAFERKVQTVFVDPITDRSINVLPDFGLIQLRTTVMSELTGVTVDSKQETTTFLILMWKEPLTISLLLFILYRSLRRARKSTKELASPENQDSSEPDHV